MLRNPRAKLSCTIPNDAEVDHAKEREQQPEHDHLHRHGAVFRMHKLRQKCEKEQGYLGIGHIREHTLSKEDA